MLPTQVLFVQPLSSGESTASLIWQLEVGILSHRKELFLSQPSHKSNSLQTFSHALLKLSCCLKVQSRKTNKIKTDFQKGKEICQ